MSRIKNLFATFVVFGLLQSASSNAALEEHYSIECEKALSLKSIDAHLSEEKQLMKIREIVTKDLHYKDPVKLRFLENPNPSESAYNVKIFKDPRYPHFFLIDGLNEKHLVSHELRTATDYGKYLSQFGLGFVFVGDFQGKSVPLFDGFVVDLKTGQAIMNISLKSRQTRSVNINIEELIKEMDERLSLGRGFRRYMNGPGWFAATNQVQLEKRIFDSLDYFNWIRNARILADVFDLPLANEPESHNFRELKTVVDMRNSGYPHHFLSKPEIRNAIQKIVDERIDYKLSLTLMWDADHVIEFSRK